MRIPNVATRLSKLVLLPALAAPLLVTPASAMADQTGDESTTEAQVCQIDNASLQWGVKESFRAYISGSIANGSWETSDGAEYDTPQFQWSQGTGTYDPATGTGEITFAGAVRFTGHDGVLDLTIANPTFAFEGDGEASLLLDTKGTDMEGDVAVDVAQEWVGDIALDQEIPTADGTAELTELETTLTNSGAAAFAGFYEAGEALDPVSVNFDMANCAAGPGTTDEQNEQEPVAESGESEPVVLPAPKIPWLAIGLGGLALLIIGFTIGLFVGARKPKHQRRRARDQRAARNAHQLTEED